MPSSTVKVAVNPVIKRAIENSQLGLSGGRPVLGYNSYISSYNPEQLPIIKNKKQVYKTHCLDKSKEHYINYGLRAAVLGLIQAARTEDGVETYHVTVHFNTDFSNKITSAITTRNPAQYFNRMFRLKVAVPMHAGRYFFVLEESELGNLHVHIVMNIEVKMLGDLRDKLRSTGWLQTDKHGKVSASAVNISRGYPVRLKRQSLNKTNVELLEMEVEDYADESLWKCVRKAADSKGDVYCQEFELKERHSIDEGLADYLCKSITDKLFYGGKNYAMSQSLKTTMQPFIDQVLDEGKKRAKPYK